jgi:ribosomal protein L37AE/L43A
MLYILLFILALVVVAIVSNRETRECRWRAYRRSDMAQWRCAACGAQTDTPDGKPPKICMRHNR